jgi:hypothetical protein
MRANHLITSASIVTLAALLTTEPTLPQQITGTPGSPSATTTIEGKGSITFKIAPSFQSGPVEIARH